MPASNIKTLGEWSKQQWQKRQAMPAPPPLSDYERGFADGQRDADSRHAARNHDMGQ